MEEIDEIRIYGISKKLGRIWVILLIFSLIIGFANIHIGFVSVFKLFFPLMYFIYYVNIRAREKAIKRWKKQGNERLYSGFRKQLELFKGKSMRLTMYGGLIFILTMLIVISIVMNQMDTALRFNLGIDNILVSDDVNYITLLLSLLLDILLGLAMYGKIRKLADSQIN